MTTRIAPWIVIAILCCFPTRLLRAQSEASNTAVKIPEREAAEHFLSGKRFIHYDGSESSGFGLYVNLDIVVTPSGAVKSATPVGGRKDWYSAATALAMNWRYTPFQRNGASVYATFPSYVSIVPPERRPNKDTPFPQIRDWNTLRITLRRTTCFGVCPSYMLTILGDGTVAYSGDAYVQYCGEYRGRIPAEEVRKLAKAFEDADYFNLFDRYELSAFDLPTYITSITFDGKNKSVRDYAGVDVGMPEAVFDLENSIDNLAGPKIWAQGMNSHVQCEHSILPRTTSREGIK